MSSKEKSVNRRAKLKVEDDLDMVKA